MREMIAAFESLGHSVYPLINGGIEMNGSLQQGNVKSVTKKYVRKIVPPVIWESVKDYILLQKDRRYDSLLQLYIDKYHPEFIYERGSYLQLSGLRSAQKNNIPHILEINSPLVEERRTLANRSLFEGKAAEIEKLQLTMTTKVNVVSTALREYFINKYSVDKNKFIVTPNAVNPNRIVIDENKINKLRSELSLENKITIGFVGSFFKWHGLDILIRSFEILSRQYPDLRLLLVGDGENLSSLKKIVANLEIASKILFTGQIHHYEIFNYIELMDIAVLADSHWYGSPVKIFEYAALGKPVIAPDNIPVKDVMTDGEDGLLVEPTIEDCTAKIKIFIDNPDFRKRLARNFQTKVLDRYTWENNVKSILRCNQ